jgi:two-component system, OmpR family, sensor histidine kinase QseC
VHSLRGRLFATLLGLFVCAWVVLGIYVCMLFSQARTGLMDHGLDEQASAVLLSMPSNISHVSASSNLRLKSGVTTLPMKMERSTQAWSKARREILMRSAGSFSTPLKPDFIDGFGTVLHAGEEWRVYAISDALNEVQVQVGRPTSLLIGELRDSLYYALGASLLALAVVGVALRRVLRWSLKSVVTIQSAITSRDAHDLTPLPDARLPCEVRPLVDSFNRLLGRVEHTLNAERRFLTEAAHELRTPLAALLTHAQVAQRARTLEEARPALDQLVLGAERSSRLSQQLLDSARVESQVNEHVAVELASIVDVMTRDFEMIAAQKRQFITLDTESGLIRGNVDELGILARNLLDNAFRYAGEGCRIAVRCTREGEIVRLEVLDDGPGVPEEERERIFDRFYRGAGNAERGSGVGLALVTRIAKSHHATITTGHGLEGRGFGIAVSFPLLEQPPVVADERAAGFPRFSARTSP